MKMLGRKKTYSRGSLLPSIVELEKELVAREEEAKKIGHDRIHEAKLAAENLLADTRKELPRIEEDVRRKLIEEELTEAEDIQKAEKKALKELAESVKRNRKKALEFILKRVIPQ